MNLNYLVKSQSITPKYKQQTEFFYSVAQHTTIGSYIAENMFDEDVARSFVFTSLSFNNLIELPPDLQALLFDATIKDDVNKYSHSLQFAEVSKFMSRIEERDVLEKGNILRSMDVSPCDILIGPMSANHARITLASRIVELFPNVGNLVEASISEQITRLTGSLVFEPS